MASSILPADFRDCLVLVPEGNGTMAEDLISHMKNSEELKTILNRPIKVDKIDSVLDPGAAELDAFDDALMNTPIILAIITDKYKRNKDTLTRFKFTMILKDILESQQKKGGESIVPEERLGLQIVPLYIPTYKPPFFYQLPSFIRSLNPWSFNKESPGEFIERMERLLMKDVTVSRRNSIIQRLTENEAEVMCEEREKEVKHMKAMSEINQQMSEIDQQLQALNLNPQQPKVTLPQAQDTHVKYRYSSSEGSASLQGTPHHDTLDQHGHDTGTQVQPRNTAQHDQPLLPILCGVKSNTLSSSQLSQELLLRSSEREGEDENRQVNQGPINIAQPADSEYLSPENISDMHSQTLVKQYELSREMPLNKWSSGVSHQSSSPAGTVIPGICHGSAESNRGPVNLYIPAVIGEETEHQQQHNHGQSSDDAALKSPAIPQFSQLLSEGSVSDNSGDSHAIDTNGSPSATQRSSSSQPHPIFPGQSETESIPDILMDVGKEMSGGTTDRPAICQFHGDDSRSAVHNVEGSYAGTVENDGRIGFQARQSSNIDAKQAMDPPHPTEHKQGGMITQCGETSVVFHGPSSQSLEVQGGQLAATEGYGVPINMQLNLSENQETLPSLLQGNQSDNVIRSGKGHFLGDPDATRCKAPEPNSLSGYEGDVSGASLVPVVSPDPSLRSLSVTPSGASHLSESDASIQEPSIPSAPMEPGSLVLDQGFGEESLIFPTPAIED